MSGPRPTHLFRRGAVYAVRFRLPVDLVLQLGRAEARWSLNTRDIKEARRRCLKATLWFRQTMEHARMNPTVTRADLEAAARTFFADMADQLDAPRAFPEDDLKQAVAWQVEESERRIAEIDVQLVQNTFDGVVQRAACRLADMIGASFEALPQNQQVIAQQVAARAEREQMHRFMQQLTRPGAQAIVVDGLFAAPAPEAPAISSAPVPPTISGLILKEAVEQYLRRMELRGVGDSQITETARMLGWLQGECGEGRPLAAISREEVRSFRDDLQRVDVTLRGRAAKFRDRLTNVRANQIKSATYTRYWKAAQAFFSWAHTEGYIPTDPAAGLKIDRRKGETKRTPPPFTKDELLKFFQGPLYTGYRSRKRLGEAGAVLVREGHWWAPVLMMFTGMRAGELAQLLPEDFDFDHAMPHLKVRPENAAGERVKTTKNEASVRDTPLHPDLLRLGLREFVERRAKRFPGERVFGEFRLGSGARKSEGMSRYWGDYMKARGVWKEGRATHVWRHTVVASLRTAGAPEEDISALVGHAGRTITSSYGGPQPLNRKLATVNRLDYGFDVVTTLGGPYDPKKHRA